MKAESALLVIVGALFIFCAAVWTLVLNPHARTVADLEPTWLIHALETPQEAAVETSASRVAAIVAAQPTVFMLTARSKTHSCHIVGALPDPDCSPGAVFVGVGTSTICVSGYTKTVRSVSVKLKKQIYAAYGVAYPQPTGSFEADHIIPLELGGSNDVANLFPEAADPKPGFKEKDVVEDYLHDEVCAGHLNLVQAQEQIASDWLMVYQALDPATISKIKQRYRSWAN